MMCNCAWFERRMDQDRFALGRNLEFTHTLFLTTNTAFFLLSFFFFAQEVTVTN